MSRQRPERGLLRSLPRYAGDADWPITAKTCRERQWATVQALTAELRERGPRLMRFAPDFEPIDGTHAFIQWKGTDVCLDFTCECGAVGHFDGLFAYALRCPGCGKAWDMPHTVGLIPAQAGHEPVDLEPENDQ